MTMKKNIEDELRRRKMFIKSAHDVMEHWPGYAASLASLSIECETDRYNKERQGAAQDVLISTWRAARTGQATPEQFEKAVIDWRVCTRLAFYCFEMRLRRMKK
jgi:hypothetical protein